MYVCIYKHSNVICMCDSPGRTKAYLKKESLKVDCKLPGVWSSFQRACQRHLCAALPTLAARAFLQVSFLSNGASVVMPGRQSWCKMIAHCESHFPFSNIWWFGKPLLTCVSLCVCLCLRVSVCFWPCLLFPTHFTYSSANFFTCPS